MNLSKGILLFVLLPAGLFWAACEGPPSAGGAASITEGSAAGEEPQEVEWLVDYEKALALSGEREKAVLVNFTGSDWCPPCMALQREVFSTAAFKEYADENLILLEIDFPMKEKQPEELVAQNEKLAEQYGIEGFPTFLLLDSKGKELKRGGYRPGGPEAFLKWVEG